MGENLGKNSETNGFGVFVTDFFPITGKGEEEA